MSLSSGKNWQETFSSVARELRPAQTVGFELLLYLVATSYDEDATVDDKEVANFDQRVKLALETLNKTLPDHFQRADLRMEDKLETSRQAAIRSINELRSKLDNAAKAAKASTLTLDSTKELAEFVSSTLQPTVEACLTELRKQTDVLDNKSADQGRKVMEAAVSEIDNISTSINLISLNASVEAARAGQYGKGFAVIASEIQELSQRSKQAVDRVRSNFR